MRRRTRGGRSPALSHRPITPPTSFLRQAQASDNDAPEQACALPAFRQVPISRGGAARARLVVVGPTCRRTCATTTSARGRLIGQPMPPFWDGLPLSTPRHGTQVHTVPPSSSASTAPSRGVWLHWCAEVGRKGRSLPCFMEDCPRCPGPRFWKGYAPALRWAQDRTAGKPHWQQVVIELTEVARHDLGT
jgi:hypothetical protein